MGKNTEQQLVLTIRGNGTLLNLTQEEFSGRWQSASVLLDKDNEP